MTTTTPSRTRILFDLEDVLTPEEIETFQQSAAEAGAPSLTDHLLNITIRKPEQVRRLPELPNPEGRN